MTLLPTTSSGVTSPQQGFISDTSSSIYGSYCSLKEKVSRVVEIVKPHFKGYCLSVGCLYGFRLSPITGAVVGFAVCLFTLGEQKTGEESTTTQIPESFIERFSKEDISLLSSVSGGITLVLPYLSGIIPGAVFGHVIACMILKFTLTPPPSPPVENREEETDSTGSVEGQDDAEGQDGVEDTEEENPPPGAAGGEDPGAN